MARKSASGGRGLARLGPILNDKVSIGKAGGVGREYRLQTLVHQFVALLPRSKIPETRLVSGNFPALSAASLTQFPTSPTLAAMRKHGRASVKEQYSYQTSKLPSKKCP